MRLGVLPIPVASIVGTVDPHKAEAFDAEFRPPPYGRERWSQMCHAVQAGAALPPISVYRFEGRHYVRDGHHRVSVARALGATDIDADVTELLPRAASANRRIRAGRLTTIAPPCVTAR